MIPLNPASAFAGSRFSNVSDTPEAMREVMRYARAHWGSSARMSGDITPERRLRAVAYGQLYGVAVSDEQDRPLRDALRPRDLEGLPALRRQIMDAHWEDFRHSGTMPRSKKIRLRWNEHAAPVLIALLFVIAFGVLGPLRLVGWLLALPFEHPHAVWVLIRFVAAITCIVLAIAWMRAKKAEAKAREQWSIDERRRADAAAAAQAEALRGRYGPYAINDFQERSPFGDADHARRAAIARALSGPKGGFEPSFED